MNYDVRRGLRNAGLMQSSWIEGASGFLMGCGLGLLAGAGIAMLMAPAPGVETRRRLASKAREIAGKAPEMLQQAKEQAKAKASSLTQNVQGTTQGGPNAYGGGNVPIG